MKQFLKRLLVLMICFLWLTVEKNAFAAVQEGSFSCRMQGKWIGYAENHFLIHAPEAGEMTLRIQDTNTLYRELRAEVSAGENTLSWDGLGYNEERLISKYYEIEAVLEGKSGRRYEDRYNAFAEYPNQALLFALPSADTLWLDQAEDWFMEYRTVISGSLHMELIPEDAQEAVYIYDLNTTGGKIGKTSFLTIGRRGMPEAGKYLVRVYESSNPAYRTAFSLTVREGAREQGEIQPTGRILPQRGDSDETIWELMRKTSVVVDLPYMEHQGVFEEKRADSPVLGTLHGQTQCLEVFQVEDGWARIGAWNHEEAEYMEGWVPCEGLKIEEPQGDYGLLLDKRDQTLTVFHQGKRLETLLVSTGRMEQGEPYQETAAGAFLTGLHRVDFSTNGLKYDFVIQYDGGNLLHQIPYAWGKEKKDFTPGRGPLGAKASHACIRIQAEPGSENGINAYWLWTHLPCHTRLFILDDPEERRGFQAILEGGQPEYGQGMVVDSSLEEEPEDGVVLTFGGDAVLGGRESYYRNAAGFPAYMEREGMAYPFSGLSGIFGKDDWTSVNLECVLKDTAEGEDTDKTWRFRGLTAYAEALPAGSVELVNLANNHTIDYGPAGWEETLEALEGNAAVCGNGLLALRTIRGHVFGFGGCRETTYLQNPTCIKEDILRLREEGAEVVIYQCHWGNEYQGHHSAIQEAMARACVRAGADLVIGHHPHVVQGIEWIRGVPVVYSLGNLCFGGTIQLSTYDGLIVQAVIRPESEPRISQLRLIPVLTSGRASEEINDYRPVPAQGEDAVRILRAVQTDSWVPISLVMSGR